MVVVDSHLHVWSDDPDRFPWRPLPGFGAPTIPGSLDLLLQLQAESGVDKAVLVQPSNYGYDHSYLLDCCHRYPDRLAAVCLVDPEDPASPQTLERLVREEGFGGMRLRPLCSPDDWSWMSSPVVCALWEKAAELDVPISFLILPNQMRALEDMVARYPQVKVIVDHFGRQYREESPTYPSAQGLLRLAEYPNTYVKVSALSSASKEPYPYPDSLGLIERIYERFGARRLMWGTDFPYVQLKEGYRRARELVDRMAFLSESDREWLLGKTVLSLYSFDPSRFAAGSKT